MPKIIYPCHYSTEDKAIYDDLLSRGENLIGKKLSENERFLLDLSAKITINQLKNYDSGYTIDQINEMKKIHKEMANAGVIETPPECFYDDIIELSDGTTFKHPLSYPPEYYYDKNKEPKEEVEQKEEVQNND